MKKITTKWLTKNDACTNGVAWYKSLKESDPVKIIEAAIKEKNDRHLSWCNWGMARYLNKTNRLKYAVYAAKQVLNIFEDRYPKDDRPRKAIKEAERYIKNPTTNNENAAADAAANAAYAAANAAPKKSFFFFSL